MTIIVYHSLSDDNIHDWIRHKNISLADVTTREEKNEEEKENDLQHRLHPVTNALDRVNELRRLIACFDNADETLHHVRKIENFFNFRNIKNVK